MNSIEKTVEDYEVRYKNLHKFFYSREFFYDWDEKNNPEIEFHNSQVEGYWNNEFVFDIYYKSNDYLKKSPVYGHFRKTAA